MGSWYFPSVVLFEVCCIPSFSIPVLSISITWSEVFETKFISHTYALHYSHFWPVQAAVDSRRVSEQRCNPDVAFKLISPCFPPLRARRWILIDQFNISSKIKIPSSTLLSPRKTVLKLDSKWPCQVDSLWWLWVCLGSVRREMTDRRYRAWASARS